MKENYNRQARDLSYTYGKDMPKSETKQILNDEIYSDLANQAAVKAEVGDVLAIINQIIVDAVKEVNVSVGLNPIKYEQRAMYATELNAIIKSNVLKKMAEDAVFNGKIRIKRNHGSIYFIVKDKYAVFIKKLTGKMNKPNCYPTRNSEKMFNGELFTGTPQHIPFLFVGPNTSKGETFVTSLISRKDVNWTTECSNLFTEIKSITKSVVEVETRESAAKLKTDKVIRKKKIN